MTELTLPELHKPYTVNADQIADFQKDGHILLKEVAAKEEIAAYRPTIIDAVQRLKRENRPLQERDTYGKAFIQVSNIWEHDPLVARFTLAQRFAKIAAELLGVEGVRIYHDQALFKEPGGGYTPWHQDQIYWPVDTDDTITLWMPLVPLIEEVGSMTFASGSHKFGYLSKLVISEESHQTLNQFIEGKGLPLVQYGAMDPGDATFHYGWTLHCAPGNPTEQMREVMTIIYVADRSKVIEPDTSARNNDLKKWMPGLQPGDTINSMLNPLVYKE